MVSTFEKRVIRLAVLSLGAIFTASVPSPTPTHPDLADAQRRAFAQDVNSTEADTMAIVQKPFSTSILLKNLAILHGSGFRHGIKYKRMTT